LRRGKRAGNAPRTRGGALGRRGAMTISSLESCILCVISNIRNATIIHSTGPRRTVQMSFSAMFNGRKPILSANPEKRAGNALRTLGGALRRRGAMTISSLESRIL
jgi:hypothetical protein